MTTPDLGHYKLEHEIGAGAMGAVYRARDTRLNRVVAIKVWRAYHGSATESAQRMLKEARAASQLNHPNIVIVHEFGETTDGDAFIVQEFIEGRTLRSLLQDGKLSIGDAMDLGAQVAAALATAHATGVVHRDIKPENVMLRSDGYAKVLDFGIAHLPEHAAGADISALETLADQLVGTPAYMAPETMLGGAIGPAADVFALGVVIYEMVTGALPFAAPTAMAVMGRIAHDAPTAMTSLDSSIPSSLEAFVLSMLDKDPVRRPTAADVERALPSFATPADPELVPRVDANPLAVGREAEEKRLDGIFERAVAGRSTIVGIAGEPGIGKSTLIESFMASFRKKGRAAVVRVRCSENLAGSEAYLPVLDALDGLRSAAGMDSLLRSVSPTWHAQLVLSDAARATGHAPSQERLKRELRAFLHEASKRTPLVWIIEDLHWADVSTVDMLNYLAGRFDDMRVVIVAAFRLSDMQLAKHPFLAVRADLQSKSVYEEIGLRFLTRDDIKHYLSLRWPANDFPAAFIDEIHSRTEGSPLFMADLVRYLHDTGVIVEVDNVWTVTKAQVDTARDLPESVKGMIARKIERVDEDDRKLLLAASVQGEEFESAPLAQALGMDSADLEDRLDALERVHRFVQRGPEHEYPDGALTLRDRFVHVLYQNVLYSSLAPSRRAQWSAKTAQALAAHYASDDSGVASPRLAVLYETARDFPSAGTHFLRAAQRASGLSGFREALGLARRGIESVAKLPEDPARWKLELPLQMTVALSLRMVKGWVDPEIEPTLKRARELCRLLGDTPALFPVLWNIGLFHLIRGDLKSLWKQFEGSTEHAESMGDSTFIMSSTHIVGVSHEFGGNVTYAVQLLERSKELHDPSRHEEYWATFGMDPGMQARAMLSRALFAVGFPDRALAQARETVAISERQRTPVTRTFAKLVLQGIHLYRREAPQAIEVGQEVAALAEEHEFPQEQAWTKGFQGAAMSLAGQLDQGADLLHDCLKSLKNLRSGLVRTMFLSLYAESLWRAGRLGEGHAVVEEGLEYAESSGEHGFLHELHRARGGLHLTAGDMDGAESSFREALRIASAASAKSFELRAALDLARLLAATGRAEEGRTLLAPIYEWFTEGLDTADLVSARELLAAR